MLLVVDVGNTNTVVGVYKGEELVGHWRLETRKGRTADEYAAALHTLFGIAKLSWELDGGMVATVVPSALFTLGAFFDQYVGVKPFVVGPGVKTGMPILTDNPKEVGADRIVNAVAAYEQFKQGCIVVDFGTATTFDLVTPKGEYAGGAIVLHGDDDQIVPIGASAMLSSKLIPKAQLKVYKGGAHGVCSTQKDEVNADLLAFIQG